MTDGITNEELMEATIDRILARRAQSSTFHLTWEQRFPYATNECAYCNAEFTEDNPCWNDEGCNPVGTLHIDGECKRCAEVRIAKRGPQFVPGPQHERGE